MDLKNIFNQLNIKAQCKKYGFSLWQCPQFLFLVMGIIIIISIFITYTIGTKYIEEPELVALITLLIAAILFVIATTIDHSFERLAEANRMKSELIRIVSHQIRGPLSNFKWALELLMSGRVGRIEDKQIEYFRILRENSDRMDKLVSNLLIVSRIEADNFLLKKEEVFLEDLINKSIYEFQHFAKASNIEIGFKSQENLPKILADPTQIRLVVENLLDNAIRYTKDGGKVKISLERKGKNLYFQIKDNGVGIPKEDQKYIFQRFFRSENALKYQTPGSGLGLYISKAIIEMSGGEIGFKSQEGKGSTFWFTLPINYK